MSIKEWTERLNNRQYLNELTKEEEKQLKESGYVVLFGYSDDNAEFRGAIDEEYGCFDGGIFSINKELRVVPFCKTSNNIINAIWDSEGYSWIYETEIPHETFEILEDEEKYCRGIIFDINDLK